MIYEYIVRFGGNWSGAYECPPYLVARRALRAELRGAVGALSSGEGAGGEVEPLLAEEDG